MFVSYPLDDAARRCVTAQRGETAGGRICVVSTKATGDNVAYRDYADRHRAIAKSLCFEGLMAHAEAMR